MSQSKTHSMIEAVTNIVVGYSVAVAVNMAVLPLFGMYPSFGEANQIGLIFTIVSLIRSYLLRRLFNRWHA